MRAISGQSAAINARVEACTDTRLSWRPAARNVPPTICEPSMFGGRKRRGRSDQHIGEGCGEVLLPQRPNRMEMLLRIKGELLAHRSVKMRGKLRNHHERAGFHQILGSIEAHEAPSKPKLTVEPRVGEQSAVRFHVDLGETVVV